MHDKNYFISHSPDLPNVGVLPDWGHSACQVYSEEEKAREQYSAFIPHPPPFFLYCEIGESQEKAWNKPISYSHILFASSNT